MPLFTAFISQLISVLQDKGSASISQLIEDPKHWSASGNRAHDLTTGLNLPPLKNISVKEKNVSVVKVSCKSRSLIYSGENNTQHQIPGIYLPHLLVLN